MGKARDTRPEIVRLDGGVCVYFVNTTSRKRRSIESYADLLEWSRRAGVLGASDVQRLEQKASEQPAAAETALERALELHNGLRRILLALAGNQKPSAEDIEALSEAHSTTLAAQRLAPLARGGWRLSWSHCRDDLDNMLRPVILSAVETLSFRYYRKVRHCAGEDCDLILVDRSPGRTRQMCRRCGARRRARKHYHNKVKRNARERERQMILERQHEELPG